MLQKLGYRADIVGHGHEAIAALSRQVYDIFKGHPETQNVFQIDIPGQSIAGMALKPWDQRTTTSNQLQPIIQQQTAAIAGSQVVAFQLPPLPGSTGLPVQFVIKSTGSFTALNEVAQAFLAEAQKSGRFMFLNTDLKIDQPLATVVIGGLLSSTPLTLLLFPAVYTLLARR